VTDRPDVTPDETVDAATADGGGPAAAPDDTPTAQAETVPTKKAVEEPVADEDDEVVEGELLEAAATGAEPAAAGTTGADPGQAAAAEPEPEVAAGQAPGGFTAELEAVRQALDERTRDLQRVSAEFANYRKRVERDRELVGQQATAAVLSALLPVLDDLDRAREHGELVDGVAAVVDQLTATTAKFGLAPFGEKGDPFDPNRHEAVAHQTSAEVTEPTCVDVLRRGYLLGDRLLRPAMVAVADPE
jgi:molecular chaperone GrpE